MTLAIFKYALPLVFGYTLFVGISGRLNPFAMPQHRKERASWYLGIWVGLAISLVLGIGAYLAYGTSTEAAESLLVPTTSLIVVLILPAVALYTYYRYRVANLDNKAARASFDWILNEVDMPDASDLTLDSNVDISLDPVTDESEGPISKVDPVYLESAQIDQMTDDIDREAMNDSSQATEQASPTPIATENRSAENIASRLAEEIALREQTEKHLRITRKALSVLEADTRHHSNDKADAVIELEEKLAKSIDVATALEATAAEEKAKRIETEHNVVELKQKMVNAKQEIRRSAAARAKALSTANKSIAFARQSVQIRSRLESELHEARMTIESRQNTMSSLIRSLEKEKRKTRQEITSIARQLVLNEKQLKARRSLEEVARSVENKLTSRLVKKVARARPLTPDMNQGEAK